MAKESSPKSGQDVGSTRGTTHSVTSGTPVNPPETRDRDTVPYKG